MAGSIEQDRIDRLSSIGFKWALKEGVSTVPWQTRFNELVQYKAKYGDCNVPRSQGPLGRWVHNQRDSYREVKLAQDRIDRLNGVGFGWTPSSGDYRKRSAFPGSRKQLLATKEKVPSLSTNVEHLSIGDKATDVKPNGVKGEGFDSEALLPLQQIKFNPANIITNLGRRAMMS